MGYFVLGEILILQREIKDSIPFLETATTLNPNHSRAWALLANALMRTDRLKNSVAFIQRAMRLNPYYPAWYLVTLGLAERKRRNEELAIAAFRNALAREPNNSKARMFLVATLVDIGKIKKARIVAEELKKRHPKFSVDYFLSGWETIDLTYQKRSELERIAFNLRRVGLN